MPKKKSRSPELIAVKRLDRIRRYDAIPRTISRVKAARLLKTNYLNLWRWKQRYSQNGLAGLQPRFRNSGKRSPIRNLQIPTNSLRRVEQLQVQMRSVEAAWRLFSKMPECPAILAKHLRARKCLPDRLKKITRLKSVPAFVSQDGRTVHVRLGGVVHSVVL